MKHNKKQIVVIMLSLLVLLSNYSVFSSNNIKTFQKIGPIYINSDSDFIRLGFPGKGTKEDPYIIEGLSIKAEDFGIFVSNTASYFTIRNCIIRNVDHEAIHILNCKNGTVRIENNTIINAAGFGVLITKTSNCFIINNTLSLCNVSGARVEFADIGSIFINNTFIENSEGLSIYSTNNSIIENNFFSKNSRVSIMLIWGSDYSEIHSNYFLKCGKMKFKEVLDEGYHNNWTGNYWSEWKGKGSFTTGEHENVVDYSPLICKDSDNDQLVDPVESFLLTNPSNNDTDSDSLGDGQEILTYDTDPLYNDSDYDDLFDGEEVLVYHTAPNNSDTDNDGLSDGFEVNEFHSDPLKADTDGDGYSDSEEYANNTNPRIRTSNPLTKIITQISLPTLSLLAFLSIGLTKIYKFRSQRLKVVFSSWEELYTQWDEIIEKINYITEEHVEEIIFEVDGIKDKNKEFLDQMINLIEKAKNLLQNQLKQDLNNILKSYNEKTKIFLRLQEDLMNQALKTIHSMTQNALMTAIKDYLWLRFVYLCECNGETNVNDAYEIINGHTIFSKFKKFLESNDFDKKLQAEIDRLAEEIKFQFNTSNKLQSELIEYALNTSVEKLMIKFEDLRMDLEKLNEQIKEINIDPEKLPEVTKQLKIIEKAYDEKINSLNKDKLNNLN
ncbi:MAG: right-handed parallel beta-helix repeat-containing protein [Candidatus Heimdallarchaeaceae archaeon]